MFFVTFKCSVSTMTNHQSTGILDNLHHRLLKIRILKLSYSFDLPSTEFSPEDEDKDEKLNTKFDSQGSKIFSIRPYQK